MTSLSPFFNNTAADTFDDPLQKSLSELWSKIEKKQKRNQKFLDDKEKLFDEFQIKVLPVEQQQGMEMVNLVEFLIPFFARKSLSEYQREELISWIESTLEYLRSHPFLSDVDHESLQNKFNAAFSTFIQTQNIEIDIHQIEKVRMDIEHMFEGDMQLTDDEIIDLIKDHSLLNQYIQRMDNEISEKEDENKVDDDDEENSGEQGDPFERFFEDNFGEDDVKQDAEKEAAKDTTKKNLDKLFKSGQLNKIYKRLAALLHPDKEQDPSKKEQKHVLMQTLSEARKNKDAFTLLQLYQIHINDGEFSFDPDTLTSTQALLRVKLHRLDDELYAAKSSNELSTLVWRKFSGRSKKQTESNIKIHLANIADEVQENQHIMQQNQTVTQMKKHLQERLEKNRGWTSDMPIDLMDLFR
ncbi:MAG: hypothetical protein ACI9LE_000421 [Paraglaciecola sp.]|jgi:hypothetical protein